MHFWELLTVAGVSGIGAVIAAVLAYFNKSKVGNIEMLVNHRLDEALAEIQALKEERDKKEQDATSPDA
jgi:hypothetical protein